MDSMQSCVASTLDLGPRHGYSEKYLLRKLLLVLGEDRWGSETLDHVQVERILAWVPDANKHLAPLRGITGGEARR